MTDEKYFENIYNEYKNIVFNLSLNYILNTEDAQDITQEVFVKIYQRFHQYNPASASLKTWPFTDKDVSGKIYVANFFFTSCPGICPKMAVSMEALQKEFLNDDEILFISHSVTPDKDSVPVLKKYAAEKGAIYNKWKLLTGQKSEIYNLGRSSYYVEEDLGVNKDSTDFLHTENFVLVDENRHIRGIYNSLDNNSMAALTNDIKVLELE